MVDGGQLASAGFKYLGRSYSEMDCQAFVEKCLADCGWRIDLPGSNAWYRKCVKEGWAGSPEACAREFGSVPAGAFLFILEHDGREPEKYKKDGLGNASHIGIVTGQGEGAIHSSSSRGCVAESKFRGKTIPNGGWNTVGLLPENISYSGVSPEPGPGPEPGPEPPEEEMYVYAENGKPVNLRTKPSTYAALVERVPCGEKVECIAQLDGWTNVRWGRYRGYMMTEFLVEEMPGPGPEPEPGEKPELQRGDDGPWVVMLQTELVQRGYKLPQYGVDGDFGAETESAVIQLQRDWDLDETGVCNAETWDILDNAPLPASSYKVIIHGLDYTQAKALSATYPGSDMLPDE